VSSTRLCILAAGGTGGHINAALAIGESVQELGLEVEYISGKRTLDFKLFKNQKVKHIDSKPLRTKSPVELLKNIYLNFKTFIELFAYFIRVKPLFVLGAGGYVCGPTLLAAKLLNIPVFIVEQNAVMGLTNKILSFIADTIFVHFTKTQGLLPRFDHKVKVVGNPTRKSIKPVLIEAFHQPLRVLVFGGSLGAKQINDLIFELLQSSENLNLEIRHQLGPGAKAPEIQTKISYQSFEYIDDIQAQYEWCDIIVARAGASTVSELKIIGKPVLLVPYPQATDNHQVLNAEIFKSEADFGVGIIYPCESKSQGLHKMKSFLNEVTSGKISSRKTSVVENNSCHLVTKEIKRYVGLV